MPTQDGDLTTQHQQLDLVPSAPRPRSRSAQAGDATPSTATTWPPRHPGDDAAATPANRIFGTHTLDFFAPADLSRGDE
jgi:hypothetical protein